eukprot:3214045-Prymnesium_polylepis.1
MVCHNRTVERNRYGVRNNGYVTRLRPVAGGLGRAKVEAEGPATRQQSNTSLTFWCFGRLCTSSGCDTPERRGMRPQRNLFCV